MCYRDASSWTVSSKKAKKDAAYGWLVGIINNEVDHENTRGDVYEEL